MLPDAGCSLSPHFRWRSSFHLPKAADAWEAKTERADMHARDVRILACLLDVLLGYPSAPSRFPGSPLAPRHASPLLPIPFSRHHLRSSFRSLSRFRCACAHLASLPRPLPPLPPFLLHFARRPSPARRAPFGHRGLLRQARLRALADPPPPREGRVPATDGHPDKAGLPLVPRLSSDSRSL